MKSVIVVDIAAIRCNGDSMLAEDLGQKLSLILVSFSNWLHILEGQDILGAMT